MKATIILNQEHNGIEIAFDSRPSYETRCNRGRARRNRSAPFPELIDRKKCGKMEWKQKIEGEKNMSNKKGSRRRCYALARGFQKERHLYV